MRKFVFFIILGLLLRLVLSVFIYSGDVNNHVGWGQSILRFGSLGAYDRDYIGILKPTYPPLALYSFVTSYWAYENIYYLSQTLNTLIPAFPSGLIWFLEDQDTLPAFHKLVSIASDAGITILIYLLARLALRANSKAALLSSLVYFFNPAVWYNSSLWGQLESPPLFFVLLALLLVFRRRTLLGHAAFAAAMLFKQSTLIFFPVFAIFSIFRSGFWPSLKGLAVQFVIFYLSYLPFFSPTASNLHYPIAVYLDRIEVGSGSNYISDHAFNLWALTTRLQKIPDTQIVFGSYSANLVGKVVFLLLALFLSLKYSLSRKASGLINVLGLTGFLAFMVLTRMHERYLAPALPFMAISTSVMPQLWPVYILLSLGHLLNMYHNWWYPTLMWLRPVVDHWNLVLVVVALFVLSGISWLAVYFDAVKKNTS